MSNLVKPPSGGGGGPSTVTIREADGSPSVAASTIVVPNGTLTDLGGGAVEFAAGGVQVVTLLYGHGGNLGAGVVLKGAPDAVSSSDAGPLYDVDMTLVKISVDVRTAAAGGTDYLVAVMDKALTTTYGSVNLVGGTTAVSSAALAAIIPADTPILVIATRTGAGSAETMAVTVELQK